jgi:hypothetical protein
LAHAQAKIEAADVNQQALSNVGVTAKVHATHPTGLIEMGEGAFQALAAQAQQTQATCGRGCADDFGTPRRARSDSSSISVVPDAVRRCSCRRPPSCHSPSPHPSTHKTPEVRVVEDGRRDPRQRRAILHTDL